MNDEPPGKPDPNGPLWRWLSLGVALAALILMLSLLYPGAVSGAGDWSSVGYKVGLILLMTAGGLRAGFRDVGQGLRHALIWLALFGGLTVLVSFLQSRGG